MRGGFDGRRGGESSELLFIRRSSRSFAMWPVVVSDYSVAYLHLLDNTLSKFI
jgi:hypothetical protein